MAAAISAQNAVLSERKEKIISLWDEGRRQFLDSLKSDGTDEKLARSLAQDSTTPKDAMKSCIELKNEIDKKYDNMTVAGRPIPSKWIAHIMENIDKFIEIADFALEKAPETVGLAWFAVKQIIGAVQNNYKLYQSFGATLDSITEMLVLIKHYDRLYDKRQKVGWQPSELVQALFRQVRDLYAAILGFGYYVKKHTTAGKLAKLGHALKDIFGIDLKKFQDKTDEIEELKKKVLESTQGAFQEEMLVGNEVIQALLSDLRTAVDDSLQGQRDMKQMMNEWQKWSKSKSILDIALEEFEVNSRMLDPLTDSKPALTAHLKIQQRYNQTCHWIFESKKFRNWRNSNRSQFLWLSGESGTGKSVLLAAVAQRLIEESSQNGDIFVQYLACDARSTDTGSGAGDESGQSMIRLQNTLLFQLYQLSRPQQDDSLTLQRCNDVFKSLASKQKKAQPNLGRGKRENPTFDFGETFETLTRVLAKTIFILVDAVDNVLEDEQEEFLQSLYDVVHNDRVQVRILVVSSRDGPSSKVLRQLGSPSLVMDNNNRGDIRSVLEAELSTMAGWSAAERDLTCDEVLEKTGPIFRYLEKIAIPYLKQPFARTQLKAHLANLPANLDETFSQALKRLLPTYLQLLQTALIWTLLADGLITVDEVMDAHLKTYLVDEDGTAEDPDESAQKAAFDLRLDQLREAGGPFLNIELDDYDDEWYVHLKDPVAIRKFCFRDHPEDTSENHRDICVRCRGQSDVIETFNFSEKVGHLKMATTCLQHLNSKAFQREYLVGYDYSDDDTREEDNSENSSDKQEVEQEDDNDDGENEDEDGDEGENEEDADELDTEPLDDDDERSSGTLEADENDENDNDPESREEGENSGDEESEEDDEDSDFEEDEYQRYEIRRWAYHIREAEKLTTDDPSNDEDWILMQNELNKFINDADLFASWKDTYFGFYGDDYCKTPLHLASYFGLLSVAEQLLESEGKVDDVTDTDLTPLHLALRTEDNLDMISLLLDRHADPNFHPKDAPPAPIHWCFLFDATYDYVQELLQHGALSTLKDDEEYTPLHYLAYNGHDPKIVDLLLDHKNDNGEKADINAKDCRGETPLHKLMSRNSIPIDLLEHFVKRGADVNAEDHNSERPLYEAAAFGELDAIKAIIDHIEDIDDDNDEGRTALHAAAEEGQKDTVNLLLQHGADASRLEHKGYSPFYLSCIGSVARVAASEETAQLILDHLMQVPANAAKINAPTDAGETPLQRASFCGYTKVVKSLLNIPEVIDTLNIQDHELGFSALHHAAQQGHVEIVEVLLQNDADPTLKTNSENTALDLALEQWTALASMEFENTIASLVQYDRPAAAQNRHLLSTAAVNGSLAILRELHEAGADLNEPDRYGWTPLLLAKQFQRAEAAEYLSASASQKPTRMDLGESTTLVIDEAGLDIQHAGEERLCVGSDYPIPAGLSKYYFEVEIYQLDAIDSTTPAEEEEEEEDAARKHDDVNDTNDADDDKESPILAVGLCSAPAHSFIFPGWPVQGAPSLRSWAYHGDDGGFFSSLDYSSKGFANKFGPGDVVGCGVDFMTGVVFFTRNGEKIKDLSFDGVLGRLFPVVGFKDRLGVRMNFGQKPSVKPFRWTNDR